MNKPDSPAQEPQIRFLVACPRAAILLMRIFAESPVCKVTSRLVLTSKVDEGDGFGPNFSILENHSHHDVYIIAIEPSKQFLISKEELKKDSNKKRCLYDTYPTPSTITMVRPVFLIRDPIRVFDSWENVGGNDEQSLFHCYTNLFRMIHQTPAHAVSCILYGHFIQEPQREIKRMCARPGVPFWETLLNFKEPFRSSFLFSSDREKTNQLEEIPLGLFTTAKASSSIGSEDVVWTPVKYREGYHRGATGAPISSMLGEWCLAAAENYCRENLDWLGSRRHLARIPP